MIILEKKDTNSVLGLRTILDIEKIPYLLENEISDQKYINGSVRLYVNYQEDKYNSQLPTIFIGQLSPKLAYEIFGISDIEIIKGPFVDIEIDKNFLPVNSASIFFKYNKHESIRLPCFKIWAFKSETNFNNIEIFAKFSKMKRPAIIKKDNLIWCLFDLGEVFHNLISERYLFNRRFNNKVDLTSFAFIQELYYKTPALIRDLVQRIFFIYLNTKLEHKKKNNFRTNFPIDLTGWAMIQFLRSMALKLNSKIVSIGKLPKGYKSCFVFTHDIEPTKFSYTKGLPALLDFLKRDKNVHSIDLVAAWAKRYCKSLGPALKGYDINCHGLYHNGKTLLLSYKELCNRVKQAKIILEDLLDIDILGYRSPRLDKSPELLRAIEVAGYKHSSVSADAERENTLFFGGGVSMNYPYRPLIEEDDRFHLADFLEFPVTAPDCISPLFMGYNQGEMFQLYREKIDYITDIEGIFVCINHAGVFDIKDIQIRKNLLDFLLSLLKDKKYIWQTSMSEIYKWWIKREAVKLFFCDTTVTIKNNNTEPLNDLRIIVETQIDKKELTISTINPNESVELKI